jgi:hypothetical protein
MLQQLTTDSCKILRSQDVPQNRQPSGSLTGKNLPPNDRVKSTGLLTHMNTLKCLQLQLTVHRVKNTCIYLLINSAVTCITYFIPKSIGCF